MLDMKEQNQYDQMPLGLLRRLEHILPFADDIGDEIVSKETEVLEKIRQRMFEAIQKIANFLCDYVKCGRFSRWSPFWILQMLTIAERTGDPLVYSKDKEMLEEMDRELANVIEDLMRAVDVEALRLTKKSGKH